MNTPITYKVVFSGNILKGKSKEEVVNNFSKAFKVTDDKVLSSLFSGRLISLKQGLDYEKAQSYSKILESLGADSCIEREANKSFNDLSADLDHEYERKKRKKLAEHSSGDYSEISIAPKV